MPKETQTFEQKLARMIRPHEAMGAAVDKLGPRLVCRCGHEQDPTGNTGAYLRSGWPEHCGETMELVTAKQRSEGYFGREKESE